MSVLLSVSEMVLHVRGEYSGVFLSLFSSMHAFS